MSSHPFLGIAGPAEPSRTTLSRGFGTGLVPPLRVRPALQERDSTKVPPRCRHGATLPLSRVGASTCGRVQTVPAPTGLNRDGAGGAAATQCGGYGPLPHHGSGDAPCPLAEMTSADAPPSRGSSRAARQRPGSTKRPPRRQRPLPAGAAGRQKGRGLALGCCRRCPACGSTVAPGRQAAIKPRPRHDTRPATARNDRDPPGSVSAAGRITACPRRDRGVE